AGVAVGGRDARLGSDRRAAVRAVGDDEVPHRLGEAGLVEGGELARLDAMDAAARPPGLADDAPDELPSRLLGPRHEPRPEAVVQLQTELRFHGPGEEMGESASGQQREDDRRPGEIDLLDRPVGAVGGGCDGDLVVLELVVLREEPVDEHAITFAPRFLPKRSGAQSGLSVTPAASKVAISPRMWAPASSRGSARHAPVPSPRRSSRSRTGAIPSVSSTTAAAGSVERCPA